MSGQQPKPKEKNVVVPTTDSNREQTHDIQKWDVPFSESINRNIMQAPDDWPAPPNSPSDLESDNS